jgi:EmrB/QacA subfamily drug resistance transporter
MAARQADQGMRRAWLGTAVMLVAVFMELMDVTMANVAVPSIRKGMHATPAQAQWVVAGYSLAFAAGLLTGGRLGDLWGRKRLFMGGLAAFIVTSLMTGIAPDPAFLITSRVLQGLAAAVMLPQVLASISVWFPDEQRAAAFGLVGAVTGLGGVVAPLIGGFLISANVASLGWRPVFLINIPIGLAALAAARACVDESVAPDRPRLDVAGALIGALGVFLLVFPVIQGHDEGWPAWGWVLLGLAAPVLAAFVLVERRRARLGRATVADLSLFRRRTFSAGLGITLVFFAGVTATAFVLMIYLQSVFGYTPSRAGLALVPLALALIVGSGLSVGASGRLGRAVLQAGCLVAAGGIGWLSAVVASHPAALGIWSIVPPLAVFGLGLGLTVAPLTNVVLAGAPPASAGSATGLQATMIQVGNSVGVAVLGAILFSLLARHLPAAAMRDTLYCDAGVFVLAAVLMFLLPQASGKTS